MNTKAERSRKKWTKEERKYLSDNWGIIKVENIANTLGRSKRAVENQAYYLGLGTQMRWYSPREIGEMLGLSLCTVKRYMDEGKLECMRDRTKNKRRMSSEDQIRRFMKNYQDLWDSRKVTINLYSNNMDWYKEKIERDKHRSIKRNSTYTETEIKILIDRYRRGWTLDQIAAELSRNKKSIDNKLRKLDFGRNFIF